MQTVSLINRFYGDFLMPSRLNTYENILKYAVESGYEFITLANFIKLIDTKNFTGRSKYFILRHDIDSDILTTKLMFEIEKKNKIHSSYYFRLSTLDFNLMKEIIRNGSEASYHFEEIATFAKKFKIKDKQLIYDDMNNIRQIFVKNFCKIEKILGYKILTIASHGDFVNRYLKIINYELLNDEIRNELGIIAEAYDPIFTNYQKARISDSAYPNFYNPYTPIDAINANLNIIYFLVHPVHWRVNIKENFLNNIHRIFEGVKYGK